MEIFDNEMESVLFVFTLGIFSFQGFSDYLFKWYMDKGTVALSCCWLVTRIRVYKNGLELFCVK